MFLPKLIAPCTPAALARFLSSDMDVALLVLRAGVWTYRLEGQEQLVERCLTLLGWDLYRYDCWLFESNEWRMYTRRRVQLIEKRIDLAAQWVKSADLAASVEPMLADFCIEAWKTTRTPTLRLVPEVLDLADAYQKAKEVRAKWPQVRKH